MRAQNARASPGSPRIQTIIRADPRKADEVLLNKYKTYIKSCSVYINAEGNILDLSRWNPESGYSYAERSGHETMSLGQISQLLAKVFLVGHVETSLSLS
jgi:hypothetical protein